MRSFIELWAGLPPLLRGGVAVGVLLIATVLWFVGYWRLAIVGWCLGGVLLALSFPSGPEQRGYHDF
jgi:hypothetical protein